LAETGDSFKDDTKIMYLLVEAVYILLRFFSRTEVDIYIHSSMQREGYQWGCQCHCICLWCSSATTTTFEEVDVLEHDLQVVILDGLHVHTTEE
jgi:hypothetical protein